jgi:hypothetical protein
MSPEERAAYDAWQQAHAPGSATNRAAKREERRQKLEARTMLAARPVRRPTTEEEALENEIAALRAELGRRKG